MSRKRFGYRDLFRIVARQVITINVPAGTSLRTEAAIVCTYCFQPITPDQIDDIELDHGDAVGFGDGRDIPENCSFKHGHCHKAKTAKDKARIAKAKRQAGETGQRARRERNGPSMQSRGFDEIHKEQLERRRLVPSRGFDTRFRKRMDGTVEERK